MSNTEDLLISVTTKWVSVNDFHDLSLRKISSSVGLTTGAVYKNFKSKQELFYKVSLSLSEQLVSDLKLSSLNTPFDNLLAIADFLCNLAVEKPRLIEFLLFNGSIKEMYQAKDYNFVFWNLVKKYAGQLKDSEYFLLQIVTTLTGYIQLLINDLVKYDPKFITITLKQLLED
ncbi:TetR/AcrR family transcriptional regulator [Ligilactobacillus equi]|uniref:HTH tetR-type domain-containing protein n=1 Tax=Ligilactobacillus equi DSM 15833 = JCM 10991 TaxID=1423740 RepID=A0A0R1T365_9LACO|nr:TetR/AcrR family transcriptional regulator [Ligilactobacillus equi]KRL76278.1 hypothetical protein FC36_GL001993 [Ligilactobacillus equi DSM 15833 = JCM 10991]